MHDGGCYKQRHSVWDLMWWRCQLCAEVWARHLGWTQADASRGINIDNKPSNVHVEQAGSGDKPQESGHGLELNLKTRA